MTSGSTLENSYGPEALEPTPVASPLAAKASLENANGFAHSRSPIRTRYGFTLWGFLAGFAVATIFAAGIGGGLGASLANCHKAQKSQSTTTTPTCSPTTPVAASNTSLPTTAGGLFMNYTVPDWQRIDSISYACPVPDFTSQTGDKYTFACGYDVGTGLRTSTGDVIADIIGIVVYSVQDCANACSELNRCAVYWNFPVKCASITFAWDMNNVTQANGGNCFLKNGTVATGVSLNTNAYAISGKIE